METLFVRHLLEAVSYLYYLKDEGSDFPDSWKNFLQAYLGACPWYRQSPTGQDLSYLKEVIVSLPKGRKPNEPLKSIFPHLIRAGIDSPNPSKSAYRAEPLIIDHKGQKGLFASLNPESSLDEDLKSLWILFDKQFKHLQSIQSVDAFAESLYNLLEAFASRVLAPEAGSHKDVSLYNWMRVKAAKEICDKQRSLCPPEAPYLLLKGDFSGIQQFIYSRIDMSTAGNQGGLSKRLRGRSFYVNLLTQYAADEIKRQLDLSIANILYTAGGHFVLTLPNREGILEEIAVIEKSLNLYLLGKLGGRVSLKLGHVACGPDLFEKTKYYYKDLSTVIASLKTQRYRGYLEEVFDREHSPILANPELDPNRTGQFHDDRNLGLRLPYSALVLGIETKNDRIFEDSKLLRVAHFGYGSGEDARHIHYFMPGLKIPDEKVGNSKRIEDIGLDLMKREVMDTIQSLQNMEIKRISVTQFRPLRGDLKDPTEADGLRSLIHSIQEKLGVPVSFIFEPVGTEAPFNPKNIVADFDELEKLNARPDGWRTPTEIHTTSKEEEALSYPLLAIMRLDIDDLGGLFVQGFGNDHSFQRLATLSRELAFFFSSYFNVLARKWKIYVTYSGGDDAFVVGSWYNVLHFAKELRREFAEFVCHHPGITFSAGIFLCDSHYPVAKFAEKAAEAEEAAKAYISPRAYEGKKNAIHLFDHTLTWDRYEDMMAFGDRLLCILPEAGILPKEESRHGLARSMVHKILRLIKGSISQGGKLHMRALLKNTTQLKYLLARRGYGAKKMEMDRRDRQKLDNQIQALTIEIIQQYLKGFENQNPKEQMLQDYLIPSQYVIMKTRKV